MAQATNPSIANGQTGTAYRTQDNDRYAAALTQHKGSTRPSYAVAGTLWIDDSGTPWVIKMYDGTDDISIGTVNATSNQFNASNAASTSSTIAMTAAINEAGATVASASTTDIGAAAGNYVSVTGTTTITALGAVMVGTRRTVRFAGILTLTHNGTSLILPGAANITTAAGDVATFISLGSGNWFCAEYLRAASLIATLKSGTSAGNVVVLDESAKLPAVDGSQLTGISAGGSFKNLLIGGSALTNPWQRGTSVAVSGTTLISQATGTVISDMTNSSAAFDGVTTAGAPSTGANSGTYVGKQWSSAKTITRFVAYASNQGFCASVGLTLTYKLQGSNNGSTWVDLYSSSTTTTAGQVLDISSGITTTTAYTYHRMLLSGTQTMSVIELYFYDVVAPAAYTADMWKAWGAGTTSSLTVSLQTSSVTASPYCFRLHRTASNTDTGVLGMAQVVETINAKSLHGKTVTLSFQARSGANYSAASSYLVSTISTGTGADEGTASLIAGTWTGQANTAQNNTLTTSFQTFTQTITVPSTATELAVRFSYTPVGTAGANDYFELLDVQLEVGSSASSFEALPRDVVKQRCAWTYRVYATSQNTSDLAYQMRATPTLSGTYTYSAEL